MVLNNFLTILDATKRNFISTAGSSTAIATGGDTILSGGASSAYYSTTTGQTWVEVGFGDTPESAEDYVLASPNNGTLLTSVAQARIALGNREILDIVGTFRNNTGSNVTVKEVGVIGAARSANAALICRKVLENPLTIAPGEAYSFNYRLKIKDS